MRSLPRTVLVLGGISFLTDVSSEMIYPLLPAYLVLLGGGPAALGIMEGVSDLASNLFKVTSGRISDRLGRKKPFVVWGYSLSGIFRSLIGFSTHWSFVVLMRGLDRVGKGLRTAPRDAWLAQSVPDSRRGAAFGYHRAMDHAGAMVGPLITALATGFFGLSHQSTIRLAIIPAFLTICLLAFLKENPAKSEVSLSPKKPAPGKPGLNRYFKAVSIFALANSSDIFLLYHLTHFFSTFQLTLIWAFHSAIRMVSNYLIGQSLDRLQPVWVLAAGWLLFAIAYGCFAFFDSPAALLITFLGYALIFGLIEPAERLIVSRLTSPDSYGRGFGEFHLIIGLGCLISSLVTGFWWQRVGHQAPLAASAGIALVASFYLVVIHNDLKLHN